MKISEFLKDVPDIKSNTGETLKEFVSRCVDIWSNNACMGYCRAALERVKLPDEQKTEIMNALKDVMNENDINGIEVFYKIMTMIDAGGLDESEQGKN